MKFKIIKLFFIMGIALLIFHLNLFSKEKSDILPSKYQKWLTEEVVHIITGKEKEVFLNLESDKERDFFIKLFWEQRDPNKATPVNEFKTEHYRRLNYANKFFGRDTSRLGCLTDRGRIYIILGPPQDIDRHTGMKELYPTEVWFYTGQGQTFLPAAFNVVFFKRQGIGEYELYSPISDGPYRLLVNYKGDPTDLEAVYQQIREYEPELSNYVLSLIPGERNLPGHPSLLSESLLSNIKTLPQKEVEDKYAESILNYKELIEVDYSTSYMQSDFFMKVFLSEAGQFFIHYSLEPDSLTVDSTGDFYQTNFEINGNLKDQENNVVFQYERNIPLRITEEQIQYIQESSFAIQDMIPVIPGHFTFNVLITNTYSKEFSSHEQIISIPNDPENLSISPLLLSFSSEKIDNYPPYQSPFQLECFHCRTYSNPTFTKKDTLSVAFQVRELPEELRKSGIFLFKFYRESVPFKEKEASIDICGEGSNFLQSFSLSDFSPGYYTIEVLLQDTDKNEITDAKSEFNVSLASNIPRPIIFSQKFPSYSEEYDWILGNQYMNHGDLEKAGKLLKSVYEQNKQLLRYAVSYSKVLLAGKKYEKVKDVLIPFAETENDTYEFLRILGQSLQISGEYQSAIKHYKEYLQKEGTNLMILNSIGECYISLRDVDNALITLERSLEINPNQEMIKKKVLNLKKQKKK